ncbi:MAG: hypothetical protein KGL39_39735 [Patescibacteria group bacterium]|nr:hypothetical protein [Patescibacteria group bacterium]
MRILFALILTCCAAFAGDTLITGKWNQNAAVASSGALWPTNASIGANFWWEPSVGAYVTNSSIATLPELAHGAAFNLTNKGAAGTFYVQGPTLNGLATIYGVSASTTLLENTAVTMVPPYEIMALLTTTNDNNGVEMLWDSPSGGDYVDHVTGSSSTFQSAFYGTGAMCRDVTNKYFIFNVRIDTASDAVIWTNSVQGKALTGVSAGGNNGFLFGKYHSTGDAGTLNLACLLIFTNQDLTSSFWQSQRSNAWYYLSNRYALTLPN